MLCIVLICLRPVLFVHSLGLKAPYLCLWIAPHLPSSYKHIRKKLFMGASASPCLRKAIRWHWIEEWFGNSDIEFGDTGSKSDSVFRISNSVACSGVGRGSAKIVFSGVKLCEIKVLSNLFRSLPVAHHHTFTRMAKRLDLSNNKNTGNVVKISFKTVFVY